jgi:hypothetical protein
MARPVSVERGADAAHPQCLSAIGVLASRDCGPCGYPCGHRQPSLEAGRGCQCMIARAEANCLMRDCNGREDQASEKRSSIRRLFKKAVLFVRRLYLVVRPFGESDLKRDTKYASRFTGVESARQISPAVHHGRRRRRATSEERLPSPQFLQARRPGLTRQLLMPDPKSPTMKLPAAYCGELHIYFTGILITIAPMTSLILKSRLELSGWAL